MHLRDILSFKNIFNDTSSSAGVSKLEHVFQSYLSPLLLSGCSAATGYVCAGTAGALLMAIIPPAITPFCTAHPYFLKTENKATHTLAKDKPFTVLAEKIATQMDMKEMPICQEVFPIKKGEILAQTAGTEDKYYIQTSPDIYEKLSDTQLETIIAHECAHIKHKDCYKIFNANAHITAQSMANGYMLAMLTLGTFMTQPVTTAHLFIGGGALALSHITRLATSRVFEKKADYASASVTKNPWALASVLEYYLSDEEKLNHTKTEIPEKDKNLPKYSSSGLKKHFHHFLTKSHPTLIHRIEKLNAFGEELIEQYPELIEKKEEALALGERFKPQSNIPPIIL